MKQRLFLNLCTLIAVMLFVAGCAGYMSKEEKNAFNEAKIVFQYFPESPDGAFIFFAGPYLSGTAVIGPNETAFWVKEGKAYTVNQAAKDAAPELEASPDTVKYDEAFIAAAHCE